jgi:PKD repeat protein
MICTLTVPSGTGTVNVTATANGQTSTSVQFTYNNPNLTLNAIGPFSGAIGQAISFTASGTNLPADAVFNWNFGDNTGTTTGQTVSHTYNSAGTFTVTVTVTSASTGQTGTQTGQANISGPINVSINGQTSVPSGQSTTYTANVSGSVPADAVYSWTFSDGGSGSGSSVTHTFNNAGTFTITLHVTSASNAAVNGTGTLTVSVTAAGPTATYQPGWNLVDGPTGTVFSRANGPLYSFPAGATDYVVLPNTSPVTGGVGYWAFFNVTTTVVLNGSGPGLPFSTTIPAGQFVIVGNPSSTQTVTVNGADVVDTFNPSSNSYTSSTGSVTLAPGQAAWVYSADGATITIQ